MPLSFRKSLRVGPLRFNLSKSGLGVSTGFKGFRLGTGPRGNYVHVGKYGLSYRYTIPTTARKPSESADTAPEPRWDRRLNEVEPRQTTGEMRAITSGSVSKMVDSSSVDLINEISQKNQITPLGFLSLLASAIVWTLLALFGVPGIVLVPLALVLIGLVIGAYVSDTMRKTVVIMYDLDDATLNAYDHLHNCLLAFSKCGGFWQIGGQAKVFDAKYHAGAGHIVTRKEVTIGDNLPPFFKTNISVVKFPIGRRSMYFFPDRVLVFAKETVGTISYDDLHVSTAESRFIEEGSVPSDARIVDRTWRYVNKGGGPDRRFKNNSELPVCLYEDIRFTSSTGLNEYFQASRLGLGHELALAIEDLAALLKRAKEANRYISANPATAKPQSAVDESSSMQFQVPQALLRILCCIMVADGRASRSERQLICQIMHDIGSPWNDNEIDKVMDQFIADVREVGFRRTREKAFEKIPTFRQLGMENLVIRAIDRIAQADGKLHDRESKLCDEIKEMLNGANAGTDRAGT